MKHSLSISLLVLTLIAAACSDSVDGAGAGGDVTTSVVSETLATGTESATSLRTIPEEAPTTAAEVTTTIAEPPPPPGDPAWLGQELELLTLATLEFPIAMAARSGGDDLWIAERPGRVRQIQRRVTLDGDEESMRLMNTVVLDITDRVSTEGEGGLLGLAFSINGRHLYASYTNSRNNSVIAEYEMGAITAFPATERILLEVEQPFANHNGGHIEIGPDGFLYIALGDGGSGGDPRGNGQNTMSLLGSILRIDPAAQSGEAPYDIPAGNPFADGEEGQPEIWLWGVRNPWRFSFDSETGDLWIADVGQNRLEEITFLPREAEPAGRGANLGWRVMEGDLLFDGDEPPPDHRPPLFTYDRSNGRCSITGGYVYHGAMNPALDGAYVFGDYCTGEVFGLEVMADGQIVVANLLLDRQPAQVVSFGQGPEGELYVLEAGGPVSMIRRPGSPRRTVVVASDQRQLGGEIDKNSNVEQVPND